MSSGPLSIAGSLCRPLLGTPEACRASAQGLTGWGPYRAGTALHKQSPHKVCHLPHFHDTPLASLQTLESLTLDTAPLALVCPAAQACRYHTQCYQHSSSQLLRFQNITRR
jgi:hypothetical protein